MQPTEIAMGHSVGDGNLWKLTYEYGELATIDGNVNTDKNTGNIARQTVSFAGLSNPFVQSYKYDALYRLTEVRETKNSYYNQTWKQTFGYDVYGNRNAFTQDIGGNQTSGTPAVNTATNRFTSTNFTYDKNGNIVADIDPLTSTARQFVFNGDNKQIEVNAGSANIGKYYYDGEGRRVKKVTPTETTIFVYSAGKLAEEYSTATPPSSPTINYTATDLLGSPRVLTDKWGNVTSRRDFMPFGEEIYADGTNRTTAGKYSTTGDDSVRKRFTGYEKDKETSLDFAEARYYQNLHGRFTAVDPLLASGKSANPQTFNRYVYVMNNPLIFVDPTGLQAGKVMWVRGAKEKQNREFRLSSKNPGGGFTRHYGRERIHSYGLTVEVSNRGFITIGADKTVKIQPQNISDSVTPGGRSNTEALVDELGGRSEASLQMIGVLAGAAILAGVGAAPAVAATEGLVLGATMVLEGLIAHKGIVQGAEDQQETAMMGSIESDRRYGVDQAWKQEAELVRQTGKGTVNWTPEQKKELLETGRVKGYEGHHINSVNAHPEQARDPNNIKFVEGRPAHLDEHGGNWRNPTKGPLIRRQR